jgi:23S rRNA pseudouridine1911/1915/1917 synthase
VTSVLVGPELAGERADRALAALAGISRSAARTLIDTGQVTVAGQVVLPRTKVEAGEVIEYPEEALAAKLEPEPVAFEVVYADEALIVVDKPAGVVVHPGAGRRTGTLAAGLLQRFPELEGVGEPDRWGIVHRLDRDTSGLMLVARTESSHERLSRALARRSIERVYLTLVVGELEMPNGTIDAPIGIDPADPRKRKVILGGRAARTHYRVITRYRDVTLLEVKLESGRTHQIRVHLASIGHPVVGDPWYGRPWRVESPRVFLHATRLTLAHPTTGESLAFESPLPPDLKQVIVGLEPA